jgi:hypothetical protein
MAIVKLGEKMPEPAERACRRLERAAQDVAGTIGDKVRGQMIIETIEAAMADLRELRRAPEPAVREDDVEVVIARLYAAARHVDLARRKLPDAFNHQEANDILDAINLLRRLSRREG